MCVSYEPYLDIDELGEVRSSAQLGRQLLDLLLQLLHPSYSSTSHMRTQKPSAQSNSTQKPSALPSPFLLLSSPVLPPLPVRGALFLGPVTPPPRLLGQHLSLLQLHHTRTDAQYRTGRQSTAKHSGCCSIDMPPWASRRRSSVPYVYICIQSLYSCVPGLVVRTPRPVPQSGPGSPPRSHCPAPHTPPCPMQQYQLST